MTNREIKMIQVKAMIRELIKDLQDPTSVTQARVRMIIEQNWISIQDHLDIIDDQRLDNLIPDLKDSMMNAWNAIGRKVA